MKFTARHASIPATGNIIAAVNSERNVVLHDCAKKKTTLSFPTNYSSGGFRLAFLPDLSLCVTGSYHEHGIGRTKDSGIACYSTSNEGGRLWLRSDLKRVQRIRPISKSAIFCGFDKGPGLIIDAKSGNNLESLRGIRRMWGDRDGISLRETKKKLMVYVGDEKTKSADLKSFAILDALILKEKIWISEACGTVYCLRKNGEELWEYTPPQKSHILNFGISKNDTVLGVQWCYETGGKFTVIELMSAKPKKISSHSNKCLGFLPKQNKLLRPDLSLLDLD